MRVPGLHDCGIPPMRQPVGTLLGGATRVALARKELARARAAKTEVSSRSQRDLTTTA